MNKKTVLILVALIIGTLAVCAVGYWVVRVWWQPNVVELIVGLGVVYVFLRIVELLQQNKYQSWRHRRR